MDKREQEIVQNIKGSLDFLDGAIEVETPGIHQFQSLVAKVEAKKKEKRKKQGILFMLCAVGTLSIEMVMFSQYYTGFLLLQIASLLFIPVCFLLLRKQKRRQEGGL